MPLPTDPMLAQQWHLHNTTPGLLDLNIFGVWNPAEGLAYTGAGTRTIVIDDGFDYNHSDLAPNYDISLDYDFELNTVDPFGSDSDAHGTSVTGIIGAAANGSGTVGIAYNTSLVGYRVAGLISDAWLQDIRDAIYHAAASAQGDVANISQGIANDLNSEFGFGYNAVRFDEIEASIGTAVNLGRGGLGMTIVKSAGNSRNGNYDVNADDWTNDTRQVVVAAVDQNGFVSSYSSYGAAVLVSAFGTPGEVVTTDRSGLAGYNGTDFNLGFNGTSSAAPMVTGIVSLMLEANTNLGWRDVQEILGVSARHVGTAVGGGIGGVERYAWGWNGSDTWNGGGQHFSNDYGYGLVDGLAAVRLAESWFLTGTAAATSANQTNISIDVLNAATVIPDGNATGLTFSGNIFSSQVVERVTVQMTFSTTFLADMDVYLISPDGTVSELIADNAGGADFNASWTFESQAFRGEDATGTWSVRVVDDSGIDILMVTDIVITTFGFLSSDDRYIFTNEYSDYAGVSGHATAISDSNGGFDTVNAAAVSSASTIRLDGGASTIDGVVVTFANIEHAIGGDGGDTIVGGDGDNQLFGMRGADSLYGGSGIDTLTGGTGNDTLNGGSFHDFSYGGGGNDLFLVTGNNLLDSIYGGTGINTLDLSAVNTYAITVNLATNTYDFTLGFGGPYVVQNVQNVVGSNQNDWINGSAATNTLQGGGGNDTINARGGNDNVFGGTGNDALIYSNGDGFDNFYGGNGIDTVTVQWNGVLNFDLVAGIYNAGVTNFALQAVENLISSGISNDTFNGSTANNRLEGGAGNDTFAGGGGSDTFVGGTGDDVFRVDAGDTIIEALGQGIDSVFSWINFTLGLNLENLQLNGAATIGNGNALANRLVGNTLANQLNGGSGSDTILGGAGNDTLSGGLGADVLSGGAGNDTYYTDGLDTISEALNAGIDTVVSSANITLSLNVDNLQLTGAATIGNGNGLANHLAGTAFANQLSGGAGNDTLFGDDGGDTLNGGGGDDLLSGGLGADQMNGYIGADIFVFNTALGAGNIDTIAGYSVADDRIRLDNAVFSGLVDGALAANVFVANVTGQATSAAQRIIYESDTGNLYFDADGNGAASRVHFATISIGLAMAAAEFFVI